MLGFKRFPHRSLGVLIVVLLVSAACTSAGVTFGDSDGESDGQIAGTLCEIFDDATLLALDDIVNDVLPDSSRVDIAALVDTCEVLYEANDDWLDLTVYPEGAISTEDFEDVTDTIKTDGSMLTSVVTDEGELVIEAISSDPASISEWDASLGLAFALSN